jgi:hypothetical protein
MPMVIEKVLHGFSKTLPHKSRTKKHTVSVHRAGKQPALKRFVSLLKRT